MDYPIKNPQQLGQVLQGLRRQKKLTQAAAGSAIGLDQSEISRLEARTSAASVERLFKFIAALELDVFIRDRKAPPPEGAKSRSKKVEW